MSGTERLRIEPLGVEHADALVAALRHAQVDAFLREPDVTTVAALHERIARLQRGPEHAGERWYNFALVRAGDGVVIGRLEATSYGAWAEIAYLLGPAYQGVGYAREGVRWLLEHLRGAGVTEFWAAVHPANARSIALLVALGFSRCEQPLRQLGSYDPGDVVFAL